VPISPYNLGYPGASGYDDSSESPNDATGEYDAPSAGQGELMSPYPSPSELANPSLANPSLSHSPTTPDSEEMVTLIFKDGRPPEKIYNYLLTRTTLFVRDQGHREIPIDQLDLVATAKVNHEAGVDFQIPGSAK
jgi:hypothetical protein